MFFDGDELLLEYHEAVILKRLGDLDRAEEALTTRLARRFDDRGRQRAAAVEPLEMVDLYVRRGQPDGAAHLGTRARALVPADELTTTVKARLRRLRRDLRPWRDATAVRRLEKA